MIYQFLFVLLQIVKVHAYSTSDKGCSMKTVVSCHVKSDHRDCNDIVMRPNECRDIDVLFGFRFCNVHNRNSIDLVSGEMQINHGKALKLPIHENTELGPMHCKEFTKPYTVSSCANAFEANMYVQGWQYNEIGCSADDFYMFLRPLYKAGK